jgi:amidophosphoribosyltransferase
LAGILGFYAFDEVWPAARFISFGLRGLQHRGQESAGIVTLQGEFYAAKHVGFVEDRFTDEVLKELRGCIGIGVVSPVINHGFALNEKISFIYDGKFFLHKKILKEYGGDESKAIIGMLSKELEHSDPEQAALTFMERVNGGYTFIALTKDRRMIVGRDPKGIKPLAIGGLGFDWGIIASESCACDVTGGDYSRNISPGEVLVFNPLSIKSHKSRIKTKTAHCTYEYVYLARPDSIVNDIPIIRIRNNIGRILARENPVDGDVVIGVPDTAIPFAMAYSNELGIPVEMGFMRTGRAIRTAIKPTQFERIVGVQLKLNPIREVIQGKRIVLIDDSVVRGTTLRNTVSLMRRKGAKEVHVRIGSPHIVRHCPYGVEVPPEDELIGRELSEEEIAKAVKADSFAYLSIKGLEKAISLPLSKLCVKCFAEKEVLR